MSGNEWKQMTTSGTTNENESHKERKRMRGILGSNETIMQCVTKIYSATSF